MEEEKKEEIQTPQISSTDSLIRKADEVAVRMEEANKRAEELLKRQEEIATRMLLGGKSAAGNVNKTPKEIQDEQINKAVAEALNRFKV